MSFLTNDLDFANKHHLAMDNTSRLNMCRALNKHLIDAEYMIKQTKGYKEAQQSFINDAVDIKAALKLFN